MNILITVCLFFICIAAITYFFLYYFIKRRNIVPDSEIFDKSELKDTSEKVEDKNEALIKKSVAVKNFSITLALAVKNFSITLALAALAIINLSYGAAGVLGFRGLWAPFKALRSYTHGYVVGVFVVGMIFLVVIFMRKGFSWDVCKKWVIGMEIGLAIFAITFAWYPQPIFKAEMKHRERAQIVQHIGSMLLTSAEMPVYTLQKLTLTS